MKLSAENKINVKNAFSLGLIDYMAEMVRKKAPGMDNFQVIKICNLTLPNLFLSATSAHAMRFHVSSAHKQNSFE